MFYNIMVSILYDGEYDVGCDRWTRIHVIDLLGL